MQNTIASVQSNYYMLLLSMVVLNKYVVMDP